MPKVIDTNEDTTGHLTRLRAAGVETVIRYYARSMSSKVIRAHEVNAIADAKMRLGIVYEGAGNQVGAFSHDMGLKDGAFSCAYGSSPIQQPRGSAVYFAVDFDAGAREIRSNVIPYFQGVAEAFTAAHSEFKIGVYGSGAVCAAILDAHLASYSWVSCSTGWSGYRAFIASGRWNLRQHLPSPVAGLDADANDVNPDRPDFGDFAYGNPVVAAVPSSPALPSDSPPRLSWLSRLGGILRG